MTTTNNHKYRVSSDPWVLRGLAVLCPTLPSVFPPRGRVHACGRLGSIGALCDRKPPQAYAAVSRSTLG
jgi:hypothetical protein